MPDQADVREEELPLQVEEVQNVTPMTEGGIRCESPDMLVDDPRPFLDSAIGPSPGAQTEPCGETIGVGG